MQNNMYVIMMQQVRAFSVWLYLWQYMGLPRTMSLSVAQTISHVLAKSFSEYMMTPVQSNPVIASDVSTVSEEMFQHNTSDAHTWIVWLGMCFMSVGGTGSIGSHRLR